MLVGYIYKFLWHAEFAVPLIILCCFALHVYRWLKIRNDDTDKDAHYKKMLCADAVILLASIICIPLGMIVFENKILTTATIKDALQGIMLIASFTQLYICSHYIQCKIDEIKK